MSLVSALTEHDAVTQPEPPKTPDVAFAEESLSLLSHPLRHELHSFLNVELPDEIKWLFRESRDLFNNRLPGSVYQMVRDRDKRNDAAYFYNLLHMGIQNSLAGLLYSLNTFGDHAAVVRSKGRELVYSVRPTRPITIALPSQKLVFEYENFTLRSRIVLDRLNWFFNYFFLTDAGNLYRIYRTLSQPRSHFLTDPRAKKVVAAIDESRGCLDQLISEGKSERMTERDPLAHREEVRSLP